jgi:hypothetical protein
MAPHLFVEKELYCDMRKIGIIYKCIVASEKESKKELDDANIFDF